MSHNENYNEKTPSIIEPFKSYFSEQLIPLSVLLLIIITASIISPRLNTADGTVIVFLTSLNISNLLLQIAVNMILSMGMFMVILTGGVDLAVGSIVAACSVLVTGFMSDWGIWVAIPLTILCGIFFGSVSGLVVSKLKVAPFIATLGMMSFARGVAYWYINWYTKGQLSLVWRSFPDAETFSYLGGGRVFGFIPVPAIIWAVLAGVAFFIIKYTVVGRVLYSIGGNEEAARLSGINTWLYKLFPYIYSGFCCGVGGVLLTSRIGVGSPMVGTGQELDSIAAVVIGGAALSGGEGKFSGVIIGVFILGIINNILDLMNVPSYPQQMLKGIIIVTAVILSSKRMKKA